MVSKRTRTSTSTVQAPNAPSVVSASSEEAIVRRVSSRILAKKELEAAATPAAAELGSSSLTEVDNEPEAEPPVKKRRTRKAKDTGPVVYEIPPVESLATTYRGRLGYACLNTILRNRKPDSIFCSRTCRIATILKEGLDFAKNLGLQNAKDLSKLIQWNEENKIRFMRISSELFPFASHGKYGYSLDYAAAELKAAGDLAKSLGHRMTLHPGQFTQLASPKEDVVDASVRELEYHTSILRHMGLGKDSMIIIHMGGVYGDKPTTLARFKENYTSKLSDEMKARVVLENDEMCYNADDLLPVCEEFNIPIVFDYHHNWLYPSVHPLSELLPRINALWHRKGIRPKQHLSSPRPGAETLMERRAHAGRCKTLPAELELEGAGWYWGEGASEDGQRKKEWVDLMIEAKDKEQAVFQLYRTYGLEPVIWENLRPEKADAKEEGSPSKGRRTRKKAAEEQESGAKDEADEVDALITMPIPDEDEAVPVDMSQSQSQGVDLAEAQPAPPPPVDAPGPSTMSSRQKRKGKGRQAPDVPVESMTGTSKVTQQVVAQIEQKIEAEVRRTRAKSSAK